MAVFTGVDKALLQRTARELEAQATKLEKSVGGVWAGQRKAKQTFDALHRDARDLRALVKRLAADESKRAKFVEAWPKDGGPMDLDRGHWVEDVLEYCGAKLPFPVA